MSGKRPDGSRIYSASDAAGTPVYVERRKGIERVIAQVKREHPEWNDQQCAIEAKARWTNRGGFKK